MFIEGARTFDQAIEDYFKQEIYNNKISITLVKIPIIQSVQRCPIER